jgi:hypothetical protein
MQLRLLSKPTIGVIVILAALLALVLFGRQMVDPPRSGASRVASAILAGKAHARFATGDDAEDGDLADDEAAAGAMWAKRHAADAASECPAYSAAFRKGCGDYVRAQGL